MNSSNKTHSTIASIHLRDMDSQNKTKYNLCTPRTKENILSQNKNDKNKSKSKKLSHDKNKPRSFHQWLKFDNRAKNHSLTDAQFSKSVKTSKQKVIKFSSTFIFNTKPLTIKDASSSNEIKLSIIRQNSLQKDNNNYFPSNIRKVDTLFNKDIVEYSKKTIENDKESSHSNKKKNKILKQNLIESEKENYEEQKIKYPIKGIFTEISRNKRIFNNQNLSKRVEYNSLNKMKTSSKQKSLNYAISLTSSIKNNNFINKISHLITNTNRKKKNTFNTINISEPPKVMLRNNTNKNYPKKNKISLNYNNNNSYANNSNKNNLYHKNNNQNSSGSKHFMTKNLFLNNSYDNFSISSNRKLQSSITQTIPTRQNSNNVKYKHHTNQIPKTQIQSTLSSKYVSIDLNNINNTASTKSEKEQNNINYYRPEKIIWKYRRYLTKREINELRSLDSEVFYVGEIAKRKQQHEYSYINLNKSMFLKKPKKDKFNEHIKPKRKKSEYHIRNSAIYGLDNPIDDKEGDFILNSGDHINYRYEIISLLGKGSYGEAVKCLDHKTKELVCLKIIKSCYKFLPQAKVEIKILEYIKSHDKSSESNIVKFYSYFIFRNHICLVFELLDINLYDYLKSRNFNGIEINRIRKFATEILFSLLFLKKHNIIHCDLKPENILLLKNSKTNIKIIDFGSSCFNTEKLYIYIQSRFYRAPEIILNQGYGVEIDMWSLGCILCELYTGIPIFPGEDEREELNYMMEYLDIPPKNYINISEKKKLFFDEKYHPLKIPNSNGKLRLPKTKKFDTFLKGAGKELIDFVKKCLKWEPDYRMTPEEGLMHKFICGEMNYEALYQHKQRIKRVKLGVDRKMKKSSESSSSRRKGGNNRIKYRRKSSSSCEKENKDYGYNGIGVINVSSSNMITKKTVNEFKNSLIKMNDKKKTILVLNLYE